MAPDLVIYESTAADVGWDERRLRYLLARGLGWDSPLYRPALVRAQVERLKSPDVYKRACARCTGTSWPASIARWPTTAVHMGCQSSGS